MRRVYGFLETAIAVSSDEPPILDWLDEFLAPAFDVRSPDAPAPFRVAIRYDPSAAAAVAATRPADRPIPKRCFALDQEVLAFPHWVMRGRVVIDDERFGAYYLVGEREVEVLVQPGARQPRAAAMRVVREIATARALAGSRRLLLHAAALEAGGRTVLLAGAKRAGKTTMLAYLSSQAGLPIVTNDRALLCFDADGVRAFGMPTIVSVRTPMLDLVELPLLRALAGMNGTAYRTIAELGGEPREPATRDDMKTLRVSPAVLARALGVGLAKGGALGAIVFPVRGGDDRVAGVDRLSPDEAAVLLSQARFGLAAGRSEPTVFDELTGRCGDASDESGRLAKLATSVPCFRLSVGAARFRDGAAASEILARLVAAT